MATTREELLVHARLRDDLSRPIRAAGAEVVRTARRVRSLAAAAREASGRRGTGGLLGSTKTLRDRMRGLGQQARSLSADLGRTLLTATRRLATGIGILGVAATVFGTNTAASFQTARVSLNRLVGGAREGADLFKFLTDLDPIRPFDIGQLQQTATQLAAVDITGQRLRDTLRGVTDVASATADPSGSLYATTRAISQMSSAGVILAEELNQLIDAGVNVGPALERAFGMGIAEVRKANAGGGAQLSAEPFLRELFAGAEGAGEEIATQTFRGLLSGVKSRGMLRLVEAFNPLLAVLQTQLPALEASFGDFVGQVAPAISDLAGDFIPLLASGLRLLSPLLTAAFQGIGRLLDAAAPAFALLDPVIDELVLAVGELVNELVPVMPELVRGFVLLVGLLPDFVRILGRLVPLIDPLVDILDTLLGFGPTRAILLGIATAVLAFGPISGIVSGVWAFASAILGLAGAYSTLRAAQAGAGGPLGGIPAGGVPGGIGGAPAGRGGGILRGVGTGILGVSGVLGLYGAQSSAMNNGGASVGDVLGGAASGAMVGGALGSVLPGVGTAIGAGVGGVIGGGATFVSGLFGRKRKEPEPSPRSQAAPVDASLVMQPGAVVIDARGLSEEQVAALIPGSIERYQRERVERGPVGARG